MSLSVAALSFTPVKGTRLRAVSQVELGSAGVPADRRFYLIDERDRMLNGKQLGELTTVVADLDGDALALTFPDGRVVEAPVADGGPVRARFYSRMREDRLVDGPWAPALSAYLGRPVRLVRAEGEGGAVAGGARGAVSLISSASLRELAAEAVVGDVDPRRFRMLIEVDGADAHAEDAWVGRRARIGRALVRFHGHVGRCLITSRDPETGEVDLPTLDVLAAYRGNLDTTEPLALGIYGEVLERGIVATGDAVSLAD